MDDEYYTLSISIHRFSEDYQVEISHTDPSSDARVAPLWGEAELDMGHLLALQSAHEEYGKALARQLFSDEQVLEHFVRVETAAQAAARPLRVLICIDRSAQELLGLRWELLRHPRSGEPLSTSEHTLLSRFMVSRDWRPVKLRTRGELTALVAVSAPSPEGLEQLKLAPVDFEREMAGVRGALGDIEVHTLGGPGEPVSLDALIRRLRDDIDILYLVIHGIFGRTRAPGLVLQDETGEPVVIKGEELAARIGELRHVPRLVVLASCQSAGNGSAMEGTTVQASLAGRLADAGVPAVIAMQGQVSMATIQAMMP